ncbi:MAG: hypothetical protein C4521_02385 [Actinobacteria bacterium]|nr:MAG: hypothetical protein C4521_02385 [Actinomycetota bacterium]
MHLRVVRAAQALAVGLALMGAGCALGASPLEITVLDGERSESYRGTERVQYYTWWADIRVRNTTNKPLHFSLDRISYGKAKDIVQAQTAKVAGRRYGEPAEEDGSDYGRLDERIAIAPGQMIEIEDVRFESHPESRRGKVRISVEGERTSESEQVDFLGFRSRK